MKRTVYLECKQDSERIHLEATGEEEAVDALITEVMLLALHDLTIQLDKSNTPVEVLCWTHEKPKTGSIYSVDLLETLIHIRDIRINREQPTSIKTRNKNSSTITFHSLAFGRVQIERDNEQPHHSAVHLSEKVLTNLNPCLLDWIKHQLAPVLNTGINENTSEALRKLFDNHITRHPEIMLALAHANNHQCGDGINGTLH